MGAVDNRAASVTAFKFIHRSPRVRRLSGRTRTTHHTHTVRGAPPYPVQRQVDGGVWVGGLVCSKGTTETKKFKKVA